MYIYIYVYIYTPFPMLWRASAEILDPQLRRRFNRSTKLSAATAAPECGATMTKPRSPTRLLIGRPAKRRYSAPRCVRHSRYTTRSPHPRSFHLYNCPPLAAKPHWRNRAAKAPRPREIQTRAPHENKRNQHNVAFDPKRRCNQTRTAHALGRPGS